MVGTHTLTVTDDNGCSDEATTDVTVTTPSPRRGGGGGGGGGGGACYFEIDMLGEIIKVKVGCCSNKVLKDYMPSDPDDIHFLVIDQGTSVTCGVTPGCGNYPRIIVMRPADEPPPEPDGGVFVGPVFDFTGYKELHWEEDPDCPECPTVTFGSPISVLLSYDPDELPEGVSSVAIYFYDAELGEWVGALPVPGVVAEVGKAHGLVNHFSQLAVLAKLPTPPLPPPPLEYSVPPPLPPPPPPPAHFVADNLSVVPSLEKIGIWDALTFVVRIGESAAITANVGNDGGQQGSYVANLKINGQTRDTKEITLRPGQGQELVFSITDSKPGYYVVQIDNLNGEFTTLVWVNWWLIGGLTAAFVLLIWLAWYYGYYRRKHLRPPR